MCKTTRNGNNKSDFTIPLLVAFTMMLGIWMGLRFAAQRDGVAGSDFFFKPDNRVTQVLRLIENDYVDSVSNNKVETDAIAAMLSSLDPHSQYISASRLIAMNETIDGGFSGIGVHFVRMNDTIVVTDVISGGPADEAGIKSGDRLLKVDTARITGKALSLDDIMKKIKGPTGSKLCLEALRYSTGERLQLTITRSRIAVSSIDAAYMIDSITAYVKVYSFSKTTVADFTKDLTSLKEQGMRRLILDLRDNAGGLLDAAVAMSEMFLPYGSLIVYTEGKARRRVDYHARMKDSPFISVEIAVLIDEYTASASEIVAGALQDNDRAVIVGRRSFGKGLVQEQHPLSDGSALRLTVARYYTPTGRSIQKPYNNRNEYRSELRERYAHGEMAHADSIHFDEALRYTTAKGKTVYGGGGITPDVFIPVDTLWQSDCGHQLFELTGRFAFDCADRYRTALSALPDELSIETFLQNADIMRQWRQYLTAHSFKCSVAVFAASEITPQELITADVVRNFFGQTGYLKVLNRTDRVIAQALEVLKNK